MNQLSSTNSVLLSHRWNKNENINLNDILKIRSEYRLNQRKNQIYLNLMEKRMGSLSKENDTNNESLNNILAHYASSDNKLNFIFNTINNKEIAKVEYGLELFKSLLTNNKPLFNNDDYTQPLLQIVKRLMELLFYCKMHYEERKHYSFKCTIMNILINLSCDYEPVMNYLIQGNQMKLLFEYYNSELEYNNIHQNALLLRDFLLLFSNLLIEEHIYLIVNQIVDIPVIIINSTKIISTNDFESLLENERNDIKVNIVILIYNWIKFADSSQIKNHDVIIIFVMNLFINELSSSINIIKSPLVAELFNALLLLSNINYCIPLFFTSKVAYELSGILLMPNNKINFSDYSITSFKIISNILCIPSLESHSLLQQGLFHFIYQRLISVNNQLTHDEFDDALVLYSCQAICNMILAEEPNALNYLLDINVIKGLEMVIMKYVDQCRIEALYVLFYASLAQNAKVNSILYKENIHLFLIAELKRNKDIVKEKEYINVALQIIEQMLIYGDTMNKRINYVKLECENNGLDAIIDKLQYDEDESIRKISKSLLEMYWIIDNDVFGGQDYFNVIIKK